MVALAAPQYPPAIRCGFDHWAISTRGVGVGVGTDVGVALEAGERDELAAGDTAADELVLGPGLPD